MTVVTIGKRTFWFCISVAIIAQILWFFNIMEDGAVWALQDLAGAIALVQSQIRGNKKEKIMSAIKAIEKWLKNCLKCNRFRKTSGDLDIEKGSDDGEVELVTVNYLPQISIS